MPTDRASHAPDPHMLYRRINRWTEGEKIADGPVLLVGGDGIVMISTELAESDRVADTPDATIFRFPNLQEVQGDRLRELHRDSLGTVERATQSVPLHQIATAAELPVYAASVRGVGAPADIVASAADGAAESIGYRELYGSIGDDELALVARAMQVVDWDDTTRYCPQCATPTVAAESECVKRCPECGLTQYPRLAPAMIVGVVRDGKLLLGQSPRFRGRFHSILAGFLEPGESAEECVRREVYEEVGIAVRNIRYFGSQSWPFPHSFMLGFTAEYDSGELSPDPDEIIEADWYAADELPNVPGEVSISGRIINWFRRTYG